MEGGTDIALKVSKKPMAFDMGIICTGIAGILPVFRKALQTRTPTHRPTYTPLYVDMHNNYQIQYQ